MLTKQQKAALKKVMPRDTKRNREDPNIARFYTAQIKDNYAYATDKFKAIAVMLEPGQCTYDTVLLNYKVDHNAPTVDISKLFEKSGLHDENAYIVQFPYSELKRVAELGTLIKTSEDKALTRFTVTRQHVETFTFREHQEALLPHYRDMLETVKIEPSTQSKVEVVINTEYLNDILIAFKHLGSDIVTVRFHDGFSKPIFLMDDKGNKAVLAPVRPY